MDAIQAEESVCVGQKDGCKVDFVFFACRGWSVLVGWVPGVCVCGMVGRMKACDVVSVMVGLFAWLVESVW